MTPHVGETRVFAPGEVVVDHDAPLPIFVLVAGTADAESDDRWLGILSPGDVVGPDGCLDSREVRVTARSQLTVWVPPDDPSRTASEPVPRLGPS